tara:strand:- start:270 stop:986 length:717 start_codon:yes stop_codon:yes gene_type:complete
MKTVYYHPWQPWLHAIGSTVTPDALDNPLFMENIFIPPTTYLQYIKDQDMWEGWEHAECPALAHFGNNTFVFYAQNDSDYSLNEHDDINIFMDEQRNGIFDRSIITRDSSNDQLILQLFPRYLLWTKHKETWVEMMPVPNGPMAQLPAMFPLGKWSRSVHATPMSKRDQRVTMKRGDAQFMIRFPDKGEKYQLKIKRPSEKEMVEQEQHHQLKMFVPGISWSIMNKKEEKKCPFRKFW